MRLAPHGLRGYGAITAVLRNDVVRKRAVVVGSVARKGSKEAENERDRNAENRKPLKVTLS